MKFLKQFYTFLADRPINMQHILDACGLRHSLDHLKNDFHEIALKENCDLQHYADLYCMSKIGHFTVDHVKLSPDFNIDNTNATGFGNMAFIALNSQCRDVRYEARKSLSRMRALIRNLPEKDSE